MLVSTSTLGGHVDTIGALPLAGRRRRRLHSDEFKADAVAAASQLGMSMASVAMARGINAVSVRASHLDAGERRQSAAVSGFQRCGRSSSTRLAGCVGSRCSTSLR